MHRRLFVSSTKRTNSKQRSFGQSRHQISEMHHCGKSFLGVDIVEYKKASALYSRHKNRLQKYFVPSELSLIHKSHKPYETLALLLAAKEAVFKSSDIPWMGPDGFRKIQIISRKRNQLSFRLNGNFKRCFARRPQSELSFLKSKDYVIAECRS